VPELESGMQDIKRKALRGGLAKLCGQGATSALRLGFMVILARLLGPSDFGLVAMVTVVTAILELFTSAGLSWATVQRSIITDKQISTLFWVNILVGIILASLCLTIAPLLVAFYNEPRLFWVTVAMGAGFLFSSAGVQHNALLQRQLRYVSLAAIEVISQLTSLTVGVSMAFAGYGYWALVTAAIVLPATMTVCMWIVTAWVPGRPRWDAETPSLLRFGGTVTLNGVVVYVAYNFDKLLIGRVWGAEALGYYGTANQLINVPTANLNAAIGGVVFSALSRVQDDLVRWRNYFLKGYALVISMTLPITVFGMVFAEDIVLVILGPKWNEAVAIFRLLTPTILVFGMINPLAWLLVSSGRQVRSLNLAIVIAVLVITSYFIGLPYGPKGVAFAFSTAMVIWLVPHVIWCVHGTTISAWDLFRLAGRPLLAAIAAVAVAYATVSYFGGLRSPVVRLLLEAGIVFVVYSGTLLFVMGQKEFFLDLLRGIRNETPAETKQLEGVTYSSLTQQ
jgi:PST family polysaccharide transporter